MLLGNLFCYYCTPTALIFIQGSSAGRYTASGRSLPLLPLSCLLITSPVHKRCNSWPWGHVNCVLQRAWKAYVEMEEFNDQDEAVGQLPSRVSDLFYFFIGYLLASRPQPHVSFSPARATTNEPSRLTGGHRGERLE